MKVWRVAMVCLFGSWVAIGLAGCGDNPTTDPGNDILCFDLDGDMYLSQDGCGTAADCDDANPAVNPGAVEGGVGDATCSDGTDNDCDGLTDQDDAGCVNCVDNDRDGYGFPASEECPYSKLDCDDNNPNINPGMQEIPGNGIEDDCNPVTPPWGTPLATVAARRSSVIANVILLLVFPVGIVLAWRRVARSG